MLSVRKVPSSQVHMSTLLERTGEVVEGGHCMQTSGAVPWAVIEKVLVPQSVQAEDFSADQVPVAHGMQVEGSEAPLAADAVPAGHGMQI